MAKKKPHILYLGDWVFHLGPTFVETPFNVVETKDCDMHFYGQRLRDALEPTAELTCLANWQLYRLGQGEFEQYVDKSKAVIISDVEAKCFHLRPEFFDRSKRTGKAITYPDRLERLKNYIRRGGGLMMLGGWLSFYGAGDVGGVVEEDRFVVVEREGLAEGLFGVLVAVFGVAAGEGDVLDEAVGVIDFDFGGAPVVDVFLVGCWHGGGFRVEG